MKVVWTDGEAYCSHCRSQTSEIVDCGMILCRDNGYAEPLKVCKVCSVMKCMNCFARSSAGKECCEQPKYVMACVDCSKQSL